MNFHSVEGAYWSFCITTNSSTPDLKCALSRGASPESLCVPSLRFPSLSTLMSKLFSVPTSEPRSSRRTRTAKTSPLKLAFHVPTNIFRSGVAESLAPSGVDCPPAAAGNAPVANKIRQSNNANVRPSQEPRKKRVRRRSKLAWRVFIAVPQLLSHEQRRHSTTRTSAQRAAKERRASQRDHAAQPFRRSRAAR